MRRTRPWGQVVAVLVLAVVIAAAFAWAVVSVINARSAVLERRARTQSADLRLCEVAINGTRADFRGLIDDLLKLSPAPRDEAEAARRKQTMAVIAERYAPVDCHKFIATQVTP